MRTPYEFCEKDCIYLALQKQESLNLDRPIIPRMCARMAYKAAVNGTESILDRLPDVSDEALMGPVPPNMQSLVKTAGEQFWERILELAEDYEQEADICAQNFMNEVVDKASLEAVAQVPAEDVYFQIAEAAAISLRRSVGDYCMPLPDYPPWQ